MSETLDNTLARLTAFIEQNSDIETGPGSVINELLLKLAASIQNVQYNQIAALDQGASIQQALTQETDTYSLAIDKVASNYNTVRKSGTRVAGKIKVVISEDNEYSLPAGFVFVQPALNLRYVLTRDTRVSARLTNILEETQLYTQNGLFFFILDVEAEFEGQEYQAASGTVFALESGYFINDFVRAEAYGNFSSGASTETDKEVISNIRKSLGSYRYESSAGIANNFLQTFAGFQQLSVCGANDNEMLRSKKNALGLSTFGKADVYVRSSLGLETVNVVKEATKGANNTWTFQLANTDAPGFYVVKSIVPLIPNVDLGGTLTSTVTYGVAAYQNQRNNENLSAAEARFTKYQTATVSFVYDYPGPKAFFEIQLTAQPNIREMQDLLLSDSNRFACADYLVKAVVPCFVSLELKLLKKRISDDETSLNIEQLKKDIFKHVNTIPFGEELHASAIIDICHNYDIRRVDLPIKMTGTITCPDAANSVIYLEDADALTIPERPEIGVTPKTTNYFIDYYRAENGSVNAIDNIAITLV
jgi:hypothetical protein